MNTPALLAAVRKDTRKGLLLIAEQLGALLASDEALQELAKGLTGHVPQDERSLGVRDALLEMLGAAEASRLNAARRRPAAVAPKQSWKEVLGQLADGNVHQLTKIASALGGESKKGSVSNVLDELEEEGLVEPVIGPGMAKNARHVRLTEGGLTFVANLSPTNAISAFGPVTASGSRRFDRAKAFGLSEAASPESCRVTRDQNTLVFDLRDHPERSWMGLDAKTVALLARVLSAASHDPLRSRRLSYALDLALPESELVAEWRDETHSSPTAAASPPQFAPEQLSLKAR